MDILDGKIISDNMLAGLRQQIGKLSFRPLLVDVLVGDDPVALSYVNIKSKVVSSIGGDFRLLRLPAESKAPEILRAMSKLMDELWLSGLIVQLPLPKGLDKSTILDAIPPLLDIDCLGAENLEKFYTGHSRYLPPTAAAVAFLLEQLPVDIAGKNFLVVGQGDLVGKPVTFLLNAMGYKVTVADSQTRDLPALCQTADIIISGAGQPRLINGRMLKAGAVVIDAGTSEDAGSIVGDVDADSLLTLPGWLSPVPGGVGPVTVAMLCRNLVLSAVSREY
ncbi:MAG: bifunctional 5,10-methylenetetrahydrofolate dehydrogenase/5,10-methenyltetrahydrofolate cyclohydrolase [Patescibacteria group bacterium]|nr:bifunctional 5,10-methylenetetrahydrofolate dehydrogenase/5,10-methenyltetrahydrofolate cyclohydrolase [Patescibacteria group bacterium]